jgi:hypothetical protein
MVGVPFLELSLAEPRQLIDWEVGQQRQDELLGARAKHSDDGAAEDRACNPGLNGVQVPSTKATEFVSKGS